MSTIDYLINPQITWTIHDGVNLDRHATGTWQDWTFTVNHNKRGGWNVQINGVQAWTHMHKFEDAMASVKDRLRDWAYMNQFRAT